MFNLTDNNFAQEVLKSDLPVLVDFWVEWCPPCQMVAPVFEELAKEYEGKVKFGKLNVDENPQTAARYGVMSIPTLILFQAGKESKRLVGLRTKEDLVKELEIL